MSVRFRPGGQTLVWPLGRWEGVGKREFPVEEGRAKPVGKPWVSKDGAGRRILQSVSNNSLRDSPFSMRCMASAKSLPTEMTSILGLNCRSVEIESVMKSFLIGDRSSTV